MTGIVKSLVDYAPLHGGEVVVVHGDILLAAPSEAAVVDDDVLSILDADGSSLDEVFLLRLCRVAQRSQTGADVADNNILRTAQVQLAAAEQDALARCRLTGNGDILQFRTDRTLALALGVGTDVDDATDTEHNGCILPTCLGQCPTQRTLASIIQISHLYHLAATASRGILSKAFCRRESQRLAFL